MTIDSLNELWAIARQYGRVRLSTMRDGNYHACIEFETIAHTTLEASSGFKQETPQNALRAAIKAAEEIVASVSEINVKLPERKLLA
jgi:hypothetical protein